jgi:SAM-dependent methyltransferase
MLGAARVNSKDLVYDLGCGDGRIVITAVKRYGARGVCVDIDPERIAESKKNAKKAGVSGRISFHEGDLFEMDLSRATVVTLYLLPSLNQRLRPKLFRELRPGSRVVSNAFDMGDWKADSLLRITPEINFPAYAYYWIIPADVAGTWSVTTAAQDAGGGRQPSVLRLTQQYQKVEGAMDVGGGAISLDGVRLKGDSISFTVPGGTVASRGSRDLAEGEDAALRFEGRVKGDTLVGNATTHRGAKSRWNAVRTERGARPELESVSDSASSTRSTLDLHPFHDRSSGFDDCVRTAIRFDHVPEDRFKLTAATTRPRFTRGIQRAPCGF